MGTGADLADALGLVEGVPGWLTDEQARVLHDAAAAVPAGARIVEIGSHHGRSTIVLAHGARLADGAARVVAVDPFPEDWRYGAAGTEARLRANLARACLSDRVDLQVTSSARARAGWSGPVHLLYVDGKHDCWTVRDDLRWSSYVPRGGAVLVHDAFSSVGVTAGLLATLATTRRLRYLGRTGSLARLEVGRPTLRDRARPWAGLPWFLRNLGVKVALRLRARPIARALGHHGRDDPF